MKTKTKIAIGIAALIGIGAYLYFRKPKRTGTGAGNAGTGTGTGNVGAEEGTVITDSGTIIDSSSGTVIGTGTGGTTIEDLITGGVTTGTGTIGGIRGTGTGGGLNDAIPTPPLSNTTAEFRCKQSGGRWDAVRKKCTLPPKPLSSTVTSNPLNITPRPKTPKNQGGCFVQDTLVTMSDGSRMKIQDVEVGMKVLTFNEKSASKESGVVKELIRPIKSNLIEIKISNDITIRCTEEHPFYVLGKGWCSFAPELTKSIHSISVSKLSIRDLLIGDELKDSLFYILSIDKIESQLQTVYNFHIEGNHNYFANGILVHNKDEYGYGSSGSSYGGYGVTDSYGYGSGSGSSSSY